MLPTYSIWLIIVLGTTDATLLSKVVKLNDGENFALASRDELGPERRLASADILFKLGQLEEKIDRLIKRKDECENGRIKHGSSCYYFSLKGETFAWPDALLQCRAKGGYLAEIHDEDENGFIEEQARLLGSTARTFTGECRDSFLTGVNRIPDSALSASSIYKCSSSKPCGTAQSRLHTQTTSSQNGAWLAKSNDQFQWIQADLQTQVEVTGVITQGRHYTDQWLKQYTVSYSLDCSYWLPIIGPGGSEQIFMGNSDRNTLVTNMFPKPVAARCIRINPRAWQGHISMRFDVLGCPLSTADLSLWLGGTDILQESDFRWATSGTRISYDKFHDWNPRQPDNMFQGEHCLMMDSLSGWHDAVCSTQNRYVCEKDNK